MMQEGNVIGALRKINPKAVGSTRDNTQETDDSTNQDNQALYEELDSPITEHDILYVLSKAKRNKRPGIGRKCFI